MQKLILFCALSLLTACATDAPRLLEHTKTVEVPVPVSAPCVDAKDVPTIPKTQMRADGDTRQLAAGAASDVYALQSYAAKADALLRACSTTKREK